MATTTLCSQITQELEDIEPQTSYTKFKLKGKDRANNEFTTEKKKIKLLIPIPETNLKVKRVHNISSLKKNAILVVLDGNNGKETGSTVKKLIRCNIPFGKIKGKRMNRKSLEEHGKLLVYILHDDNVDRCLVKTFRRCVENQSSYEFSKCGLRDACFDGPRGLAPPPREQDGDVIGGN